jgi:predicted alpha/beta hydrolase family esterase
MTLHPRQILFVQGGGEAAYDEWDNKLVASLGSALGDGYTIRYPRMPNEADPNYARWAAALRKEIAALEDGAIVVAHSIGATTLINALAEEAPSVTLGGVYLLAAPFVGEGGWAADEIGDMSDIGERLPARLPIHLYHGDTDETAPIDHLELYSKAIPDASARRLHGRDHQLNNDLSEVAADILAQA